MKKILFFVTLSSILFFFIAASCSKKAKGSLVAKHVLSQQLPKNWPWRGVCVESKKTHANDIKYLANSNVNLIRLLLKPNKRSKREKVVDLSRSFYAEIEWADSLMDELKKYNMTCVLAFDNLVLDPTSEIDDKSPEFWDNRMYQDSVSNMVDVLAKHFQNRGDEFSCYEVIGEPAISVKGMNLTPDHIEDFYKKQIATIRRYDQKRFFLLSPGPWGQPSNYANFNGYTSINDPKVIYGAHMYMPDTYTHQGVKKRPRGGAYPGSLNGDQWDKDMIVKKLKNLKQFEQRNNALIYMGEFQCVRWADGANKWIKDIVDIFEDNGWSWSIYAFQCDTEFWDPYFAVDNPADDVEKRTISFHGKDTEEWQLMLGYFKKNAK